MQVYQIPVFSPKKLLVAVQDSKSLFPCKHNPHWCSGCRCPKPHIQDLFLQGTTSHLFLNLLPLAPVQWMNPCFLQGTEVSFVLQAADTLWWVRSTTRDDRSLQTSCLSCEGAWAQGMVCFGAAVATWRDSTGRGTARCWQLAPSADKVSVTSLWQAAAEFTNQNKPGCGLATEGSYPSVWSWLWWDTCSCALADTNGLSWLGTHILLSSAQNSI